VPQAIPRRSRVAALAVAVALASTTRVVAQVKAPRSLADSLEGEARSNFEKGRELFEHGDFATAHAKFRQAYDRSKDPRLVWNMAACSSKQKRYARAIAEAKRYLSEGGNTLTAEQQERARAFVVEMRDLVGETTLVIAPAGASLSIDGEPMGPVSAPIVHLLEVGSHDVRITKDGFVPLAETLFVRDTAARTYAFALEAIAQTGRLVVETDREASIAIDGVAVARGFFEGQLAPGPHAIRIVRDGREPYDVTAQIAAGTTKQLAITLRSTESTPWWPWAVGGVVVAGVAVGSYYLFKPEDIRQPYVPGTAGVDFVLP
jgi:hypothetical protein